jgi:hypothetical protein
VLPLSFLLLSPLLFLLDEEGGVMDLDRDMDLDRERDLERDSSERLELRLRCLLLL